MRKCRLLEEWNNTYQIGDEVIFHDNSHFYKGTVEKFIHNGNAMIVRDKYDVPYKVDLQLNLLPAVDEIRLGNRIDRFGDDLKWHRVQ